MAAPRRRALSAEITVTLRRSSAGYGMTVKPVVIRSAPTSGPLVSGTYTMLEVAGIDAAGVAAAAGVQAGDIVLKVCGLSVQSGGSQALMAAMAMASVRGGGAEWRFLRIKDAAVSVGGTTSDRKRMAAVLRAYQERAATLVQAQWRGLHGRKQVSEQLEHEASLFEQRLSKPAENAADPAACGRISEREKSDAHVAVRHRSAVRIQSRWRGVQARQKYWIQLEDEAERLEREMTTVKAGVASAAAPRAPHGEGEGRPVGAAGNAELLHGSELSQPVERPTEADRKDLSPDIQCTFGNAGSLGIGFGCQGVKGPVYITKIKDGSAAAQQPQLRPGLVLTAVQGASVTSLDFHNTLQLIKHAPRPVVLVFTNPPASSKRSDRGFDERPAKFTAAQPNAGETSAVVDDLTGSSGRLGQQLQSVAGPESDSARALEVLKQARQRLSDAHQYQMKMALQAATEAAERQVREATQATNRRHEQLAAQTRQAHVKHVQARVAEAQQLTAQQHVAAAVIQSKHRQRSHRKCLSLMLQQVAIHRDVRQRKLESSASELRQESEQQRNQQATQVQVMSAANTNLQQDLLQMSAQRDEAKRQQVLAEKMYDDETFKSEQQSRRAAELELMMARTEEECSAKLHETQRALHDEEVAHSRTNGELLAAKDRHSTAQAALERRHVSAAKIQAAMHQRQHRRVVRDLLCAHTAQKQMHQALVSTAAADADVRTRKHASMLQASQQQLESVVSERDVLATEVVQAQTQACTDNHAAATIQRHYRDFCHSRTMKQVVAAAAEANQQRSAASCDDANQLTATRTELAAQHLVVQDLRRELAVARDSQRRGDERQRATCSELQRAWRSTRQLQADLADMRNAVSCHQQILNDQLRIHAAHAATLIQDVHEDHTSLVASLSEEKRKVRSLHGIQLASADEVVQLQESHTSQLASYSSDLRDCRAALVASQLAERQATQLLSVERRNSVLHSDADTRSREEWVAKVQSAQELVREAELRVQAVQHRAFAQQDETTKSAVAAAVREAGDAAASELATEQLAATSLSDEEKLEASLKLSAALQRAESAETELNVIKKDLDQAKQELSALENDAQEESARQDAASAASVAKRPASESMASDSIWANDTPSGDPAWEEIIRENAESKVAQMRAEVEAARLRRQLQLTTQLLEELETESAQKDDQIAALQSKVNALRRHARSPRGHSSGTVAPVYDDGTELSAHSNSYLASRTQPSSRQQARSVALDPRTGGTAIRGWQSEAGIAMNAPSRKMTDLESSVGDLVQRLQSLGNLSANGVAETRRQTDQRELDDLRRRLRSADGVPSLHRWHHVSETRAASGVSDAAMVR